VSPWGWRPERTQGIWRHGPLWFRPLVMVSPWAAAVLCYMTMHVVGGSLTAAKGVLFDLPGPGLADGEATALVVLVMPLRNETTVFFDDARYALDDGTSVAVLGEHLAERMGREPQKTLLVLADRRIPCGDLATLAAVARSSGADKVLFANKSAEDRGE